MDDLIHDLLVAHAGASRLAGVLRAAEADLPAQFAGKDERGITTVLLDRHGAPIGLQVTDDWTVTVADGTFEQALASACAAASAVR